MNTLRITTLIAIMGLGLGAAACKKSPEVTALSEEEAQNPVAVFQKGVEYLRTPGADGTPNYEQAYQQFVKSAELQPNAKVHFNAAWTAERLGNLESAEKHYRKAFELDPAYDKAMFSLARVLNEEGKNAEVVALYQTAVEKKPNDIGLRNDLILALSNAKDYEAAEAQAQEILRRDPENAAVYRALSTMYFDQDKLALSQLANEKALSITDADPGIYNNMGVTYVLQKDNERAIERFQTAIKLNPKHFEANMNLGFIALDSGDYGLALTSFQNATEANPQSMDAKLGLAVALRGTGDFEGADRLYREIIKANPKGRRAYFNGATLHEKYTKEFKKAQKYLDDFIAAHVGEIGPDHEVYERKARIDKSIADEKARQEELARIAKEEEERRKRNEQLLNDLKAQLAATEARVAQCNDEMVKEMAGMYVEQVKAAVGEEGAASMAGDLKTFLDDANLQLDTCTPGGDAGGGGEAGGGESDGGEEAPQ